MAREPVLSRHRLPRTFRVSLAALWVLPVGLLVGTILLSRGFTVALLDPRLWLPLALMLLPALYVWREGVDVLPSGIVRRVHWPRYYPYEQLDNWYFDKHPDRRMLTVWDGCSRKVLECRAGHLTDLPRLMASLKTNLRDRQWPV